MVLEDALSVVQMLVSIVLIILVVVQGKGSGIGALFGGADGGGITRTRRGLEKTLFQITIGVAVIFIANAIVLLLAQ
jgi:preprotein translocase subunit SecG